MGPSMIEGDCGAELLGQPALPLVMQKENSSALNYSSFWLHFRPNGHFKAADRMTPFEGKRNQTAKGAARRKHSSECEGHKRLSVAPSDGQKVGRHMTACHLGSLVTVSSLFTLSLF